MKLSARIAALLITVGSIGLATSPAAAQNIVTNPTFDPSCDATGWTETGPMTNSGVDTGRSGCGYWMGEASPGGITQSLLTIPGAQYAISFWAIDMYGDPTNTLNVTFGSGTVFSGMASSAGWTNYSATLFASAASTTLDFSAVNAGSYTVLDDISVTRIGGETTTPEPASLMLLGSGLVGLGGFVRRRRQSA